MDQPQFFQLDQLQLFEKVGNGAFGEVFRAKERNSGQILAVKISIESLMDKEEEDIIDEGTDESTNEKKNIKSLIRNLVREVNIMSKFNHPSIVKFIGFSPVDFSGGNRPVIITEFLSNGTLSNLINLERRGMSHEKWNDTRKLITLYGIASAMSFLHSHNIIHRDLKPENIMMDDELYPKVADFGLSKIMHTNMDSMSMNSTMGVKGTLIYLPPESLFECEYSKATDVYAFAMIAYEILTNEKPFGKCNFPELISNLTKGKRPEIGDFVPESYKKLIMNCWEQDSSNRPTFDEIIEELKENPGFITETINEDEYYKYIDYIDEYETSFNSGKPILSIDEFMKTRSRKPRETHPVVPDDVDMIEDNIKVPDDNLGLILIQRFARNGDVGSMKAYAAELYSDDPPIGNHKKEAALYFKKAANLGDVFSMTFYAAIVFSGAGIPMNKEEAAKYYKMAADKDDLAAAFQYGKMLLYGDGIPSDIPQSLIYLKKAADNGNETAMLLTGQILQKGDGVPVDTKESVKYFKMAAEKGNIFAMYIYGLSFFVNNNTENDKSEGLKYLKMAADNGNVNAMRFYGQILSEGEGIQLDEEEGLKYIKKAIENDDVDSMFIYAKSLYFGKGVNINKEEAAKYFKMSADKGNIDAMKAYSHMLKNGDGIPANEEEAKKYLEMSKEG